MNVFIYEGSDRYAAYKSLTNEIDNFAKPGQIYSVPISSGILVIAYAWDGY